MDHLSDTPHFSLEDLEFFVRLSLKFMVHLVFIDERMPQVVDEADRLMAQSFDDWLPSVMDELHRASENTSDRSWLNPIPMVPRKRRVSSDALCHSLNTTHA